MDISGDPLIISAKAIEHLAALAGLNNRPEILIISARHDNTAGNSTFNEHGISFFDLLKRVVIIKVLGIHISNDRKMGREI